MEDEVPKKRKAKRTTVNQEYKRILEFLEEPNQKSSENFHFFDFVPEKTQQTVEQRLKDAETRIQEAAADDAEGDIKLKKFIAWVIISILCIQTALIFLISISQGLSFFPYWPYVLHFHLDHWDFRILVSATLVETYYLMRIVVRYLFPSRN